MDRPIFSKRLIELRNLKELTQQQVANLTGLSRARLNNYEQGIRQPDIDTSIKLAIFYGVTTDYLLGHDIKPDIIHLGGSSPQQFSDDELALIEKYRKMKDNQKDTMHKVADTIAPDDEQVATFAKGC